MMRSRRAWLVGVVSALSCTSPQGKPPPPPPPAAPDLGDPGIDVKVSVLGHHRNPTKDGLYVDPALTRAAARRMHRDTAFDGRVQGDVYAQPLYVAGGAGDLVLAVTEQD